MVARAPRLRNWDDYLHKQVCSGAVTREEAQKEITSDWLGVWKKMNGGGDDGEETGAND